jgi:hypothetical protein
MDVIIKLDQATSIQALIFERKTIFELVGMKKFTLDGNTNFEM